MYREHDLYVAHQEWSRPLQDMIRERLLAERFDLDDANEWACRHWHRWLIPVGDSFNNEADRALCREVVEAALDFHDTGIPIDEAFAWTIREVEAAEAIGYRNQGWNPHGFSTLLTLCVRSLTTRPPKTGSTPPSPGGEPCATYRQVSGSKRPSNEKSDAGRVWTSTPLSTSCSPSRQSMITDSEADHKGRGGQRRPGATPSTSCHPANPPDKPTCSWMMENVTLGALVRTALATCAAIGTALVLAVPAVAAHATKRDPGVEFGHALNVTRLSVNNGTNIRMVATVKRLPRAGKIYLGFYGGRDYIGGNVTINKRRNHRPSARFDLTYPESEGQRAPCRPMKVTWDRSKRQVAATLPQSCWSDATGNAIPRRWDFYAQTGDGNGSYDYVQIRNLKRG